MKHIKKFETLNSANGFITPKPFVGTVQQGNAVIQTNQVSKLIVENNKLDSAVIISGTWDPNITNSTKKVIISGEVELNGKTDCYSLTFESDAHLTINTGARLRVWEGGITNNDCDSVNYLTIVEDAVNDMYGEFLLHPGVTVNNHPKAHVEFIIDAHKVSDDVYKYCYIGIPLYFEGSEEFVKAINWEVSNPSATIYFKLWNNGAWKELTAWNQLIPFKGYITSNSTANNIKYTFKGKLVGNIQNSFTTVAGKTVFIGNSYLGYIDLRRFYNYIHSNDASIMFFDENSNLITINENNIDTYKHLNPLQAYFIGSDLTKNINIDYKTLYWDPSFEN